MARILLGVSGGIAAYKALDFVRLATGAGHSVRVIQTPSSLHFVGVAAFATLSGAAVLCDEFEADPARGAFPGQAPPAYTPLPHLRLVHNADVYLVAPASANTLARLAHGLADNLLCTAALAARCPLIVAPSMNDAMYEHPATQANLQTLRERGAVIVEPTTGRLASHGEWGRGRLAEPDQLLATCELVLAGPDREPPSVGRAGAAQSAGPAQSAAGAGPAGAAGAIGAVAAVAAAARSTWEEVRVLVTAGGTREAIDSVRFVGNRSSGRMGYALARAAAARGASVNVLAANVALERSEGIAYREVVSAAELQVACEEAFDGCDVLLMAAAVADFRPIEAVPGKILKDGGERLVLELERTPDILTVLAARRRADQTIVGFAAEHGPDGIARARAKLSIKELDAVVLNDISQVGIGFDSADNEVTILTSAGALNVPRTAKSVVAEAVLDAVERVRARRGD